MKNKTDCILPITNRWISVLIIDYLSIKYCSKSYFADPVLRVFKEDSDCLNITYNSLPEKGQDFTRCRDTYSGHKETICSFLKENYSKETYENDTYIAVLEQLYRKLEKNK